MSASVENYQQDMRNISRDLLDTIKVTSDQAELGLNRISNDAYTGIDNSWTATDAIENNRQRIQLNREMYMRAKDEPIFASVTVADENGVEETYYFTKGFAVTLPNKLIARPNAPVGTLLNQDVGDVCHFNGKEYEILQKNIIKVKKGAEWDAKNTFFFLDTAFDKESLRNFLELAHDEQAVSFSFLEEDTDVSGKIKKDIIENISLRDNPALDKIQDEIMRMSPHQQVVLMGPPGTGKTTTLIRKLSLNLDPEYSEIKGDNTWYMFTPTELLKTYLKEAFNREYIAAPDSKVFVWDAFAKQIGRQNLKILRDSSKKSGLIVVKDEFLKKFYANDLIDLYTKFDKWQISFFINNLVNRYNDIKKLKDAEIDKIFQNVNISQNISIDDLFKQISKIAVELGKYINQQKEELDKHVAIVARRSEVLAVSNDKIREFLYNLQKNVNHDRQNLGQGSDGSEDLDDEEEEDLENLSSRDINDIWRNYIIYPIKALSRSFVTKTKISPNTFNGLVGKYINFDTFISDEDKKSLGEMSVKLSLLRNFAKPYNPDSKNLSLQENYLQMMYLRRLTTRYKAFRKENSKLYNEIKDRNKISINELDLLILQYLKINERYKLGALNDKTQSENIKDNYLIRNQVFVDEITDFSPLQIAIMYMLLDKKTKCFFGAGDFNQRLTSVGLSDIKQLKWAIPTIQEKEIHVSYRQSKQLLNLSQKIIHDEKMIDLPKYTENDRFDPVIAYNLTTTDDIADWLANRIKEIEDNVKFMPSTAILVNTEEEIEPLAKILNEKLEDYNISVDACLKGQILGNHNNVRIFSMNYIKGLEFEAVFFIGVDDLVKNEKDIFDKYLYVGASRAATFLGMTVSTQQMPRELQYIENLFTENWEDI